MSRPEITFETEFKGFPIRKSKDGNRIEILSAIQKTLEYMWKTCSRRIFVCHYTVSTTFEDKENVNGQITRALQSWRRTMLNRKIRMEYLWCREEGFSHYNFHPHYHIFGVFAGKYIQSAKKCADHLNRLICLGMGYEKQFVHINPPGQQGYRWGKKVSEKLDNFADAFLWISYIAKVETKAAPHGQRTYGFSKGFLTQKTTMEEPAEATTAEINTFETETMEMSKEDWLIWGGNFNVEEYLDFNPVTGGSYRSNSRTAQNCAC